MQVKKLFDDTPYIIAKQPNFPSDKENFYPTNAKVQTLCKYVTLTDRFQQPIISPYLGNPPHQICAVRRIGANERKLYGGHFYNDDTRIESYWNKLPKYVNLFSQFSIIIGIDLSCTEDLPEEAKRWNCFRNKLFTAYLQNKGVKVIPNVCWWDGADFEYCLDGFPRQSVIAINSTGLRRNEHSKQIWIDGYQKVIEKLKPTAIVRYGAKQNGEVESISHYYPNDNERR